MLKSKYESHSDQGAARRFEHELIAQLMIWKKAANAGIAFFSVQLQLILISEKHLVEMHPLGSEH